MANPSLADLAGKVPALVKAGIKGLSDDDRLGLTVALVEGGRMTFSEIKAKYGLNSGTLSGHLAALQKGDLVRNYYEKNGERAYSYYEATDLPKVMLNALFIAARKMRVVEDRPVRAIGYGMQADLYRTGGSLSDQQVAGLAGMQGTVPCRAYSSVTPNLNNDAAGGAQYSGISYQLGGNAAGGSHATVQGVHNE